MPVRLLVAATAALVSLVVPAAAVPATTPELVATVGVSDGFNIALRDASGAPVRHLDPGTYAIEVHDRSEIHNFHLFGPGVDVATAVGDAEDVTWTVTLTDGTYQFQCDPHAGVMRGSFTVGNVTAPTPATRLSASVGPGRRISLRGPDGNRLTLLTGRTRVVVTVVDRSRTDNFHLRGKGVDRSTGRRFRGRVTWRVTLGPGGYVYRSDAHRTLRGSFTVTSSVSPG